MAIHYFALSSPTLAVRRVKLRVALGGHSVPAEIVRRRFGRSLANFLRLYAPLADHWAVYDNSASPTANLVAEFDGDQVAVKVPKTWQKLQRLATVR